MTKKESLFYFIHLFKRHRMKGAKVAVQTVAAADSNPKPPAISAWTPFLVCKQISFFFFSFFPPLPPFSFYLALPPVKRKGKFRWTKSICSFTLPFFPLPSRRLLFSLSQTQFSLRCAPAGVFLFFLATLTRRQFIRQQSFNLYH